MQITTVAQVEYRRKFNLGNYESLELGITLYAKVDPEENADAVAEFLWQQAKASVKEQAAPVLKAINYQAQMKYKDGGVVVEPDEIWEY